MAGNLKIKNDKDVNKTELLQHLSDIEWDDFEAKKAYSKLPKSIWETVSAFSNSSGGWVVLGVSQIGKRFEITGVENPGAFPRPIHELLKKDISLPRNPVIAKLFRMVNLADNAGYGFDKMLKWETATKTKVLFDNSIDIALVTFRISHLTNEDTDLIHTEKEGGQIGDAIILPKSQEQILELIKNDIRITRKRISEILEINQSAVQKHLDALKKKGILERVGGTRGYWKIHNNE